MKREFKQSSTKTDFLFRSILYLSRLYEIASTNLFPILTPISGITWSSVRKGRSNTFYVNFNSYDLEVQTRGSHGGEFDLHFQTSSGDIHLEFDLSSYSSSLRVYAMCTRLTVYNVPVPATSTRIWRFSKDANYFYIYCDNRRVATISRSSLSCISNYDWANLGSRYGRALYFDGTDDVSRYWRLSTGDRCK